MATNYEKYFGTPEKAAKYIRETSCKACPYRNDSFDCIQSKKSCDELVLEWLKEEASE